MLLTPVTLGLAGLRGTGRAAEHQLMLGNCGDKGSVSNTVAGVPNTRSGVSWCVQHSFGCVQHSF